MGKSKPGRLKRVKPQKSRAEKELEQVVAKATEIGVPMSQIKRGGFVQIDVPKLDPRDKTTTTRTLANRGGTPVARWKEARLLSDSQIAAIVHCEGLWEAMEGRSLVMNYEGVRGAAISTSIGWKQQDALDSLRRIKGYFPPKWWSIFESVCRFDEPAGFAGSRLTDCRNDQVCAARTTVQFVADIIAMKEHLTY